MVMLQWTVSCPWWLAQCSSLVSWSVHVIRIVMLQWTVWCPWWLAQCSSLVSWSVHVIRTVMLQWTVSCSWWLAPCCTTSWWWSRAYPGATHPARWRCRPSSARHQTTTTRRAPAPSPAPKPWLLGRSASPSRMRKSRTNPTLMSKAVCLPVPAQGGVAANISELFPKQYSVRVCVGGGGGILWLMRAESNGRWLVGLFCVFFNTEWYVAWAIRNGAEFRLKVEMGWGGCYMLVGSKCVCVCVCVCVCTCMHACVHVCMRACVCFVRDCNFSNKCLCGNCSSKVLWAHFFLLGKMSFLKKVFLYYHWVKSVVGTDIDCGNQLHVCVWAGLMRGAVGWGIFQTDAGNISCLYRQCTVQCLCVCVCVGGGGGDVPTSMQVNNITCWLWWGISQPVLFVGGDVKVGGGGGDYQLIGRR